ncbi:class I SAM-dependent methyltransferase [Streptacidiphilus sp. ASG 303]|uniref:class I SAM-dependent methyltransferase n=1 Tax=Streptomycetaceae TaxID=2062 RepID=UPI001E3DF27D|nr:methyltransferase domain-containing protein [Streptacidiphilus sp. ASG 303]MCD0484957.1 class I SAM-dependent methyltransferase [Streptacidiphilus sp. ASG 303]
MASAQVRSTAPELTRAQQRARDWAEIQERMLVPLYEAVYHRLEVGPATSVLGLGCRSGLALLLAAARGAEVAGLEPEGELRSLARDRRLRVLADVHRDAAPEGPPPTTHSLVTAFENLYCAADPQELVRSAARLTLRGGHVVLATWGPPERCESAGVLDVARRLAPPPSAGRGGRRYDPFGLSAPGKLESLVVGAGLRPDGSGRVSCPFAYPDLESAVRGLLSTGVYDTAAEYSGEALVVKELTEALHPYLRDGGAVRMANVFRYVVAQAL